MLHWFTGTASEAKRAAELGCYFSINAEMLRSPKHRALVSQLPLDRLLTETDGPFVAVADRPARPIDVEHTLTALADTLGMAPTDASSLIIQNLANLAQVQ